MQMVQVKTSELSGAALDYATALVLGKRPSLFIFQQTGGLAKEHNYSTDWAQGGPIIEREEIDTEHWKGVWAANMYSEVTGQHTAQSTGTTPLIAAMRCYVASKLGDSVEVPSELF